MECNKDEATRAIEIAERKFTARDIAGAKKFALKAQNLYPELEGLSQMLATLDVYISAENKISGEADWYGILGVDPLADDETVRKQYRKLALMLHPDKNKSIGADEAFKHISEAWSLLSDKAKRIAYDLKRNLKGLQQKVPPQSGVPSAPPGVNGFNNFTNSTTSNSRAQKSNIRVGPTHIPASSRQSKPHSFWTSCHRCKMQYEYLRVYLNHNLLCPNCHEPFLAVETAAPPSNGSNSSTPWSFSQQHQKSNHQAANRNTYNPGRNTTGATHVGPGGFTGLDSFNRTNFQQGSVSRMAGVGSATASASTREEALQRKSHVSKRMGSGSSAGFSNAGSSSILGGERPVKKRRDIDDGGGNNYGGDTANQMAMGSRGAGMGSISAFKQGSCDKERVNGISGIYKLNSTRELSQFEIRNMLMEKALMEIRKKLNEWSSAAADKAADNEKEKEKEKVAVNGDTRDRSKFGDPVDTKKEVYTKKSFTGTSGADLDTEVLERMSINVPDPDFHDFDKDRTERSFGDNQVWAAYDDDDGMPRYYAMINKVISFKPFKMRIGWLNSKTNSELGPLDWTGSGFSKTCGDFRIGRYEVNGSLNSFSHKVRWKKGTRGAVRIFPGKGDVWALYRNWSPDWNKLTPDEVIHKYDMVEVLDDYNEEQGVSITPLVKVAGFKTVFQRLVDPREVRRIPREAMFQFSHQVPSYFLTGQEAQNAPKGCWELDPAASPLELLQVITEAKEEEMVKNVEMAMQEVVVENAENVKEEEMLENSEKATEEEIVENAKKAQEGDMVGNAKATKEEEMLENSEKAMEEEIVENAKKAQEGDMVGNAKATKEEEMVKDAKEAKEEGKVEKVEGQAVS
ncbi:hypothetical protein HHK36_029351 [Tetracentron sinense]|uniref:J domain-containing protein n=1 Tax=Tetracentron sinense TaxID=13715 RepID=A0A834YAT9_TETSI|nr:hypothetical protein HHK36_029351 [Tetracentron sinense]